MKTHRPPPPDELLRLPNLGRTFAQWLQAAGIRSAEQLRCTGAVEAFRAVRSRGFQPTLVLLYALEAALLDVHWSQLSADHKARLRRQLEQAADDNLP